MSRKAKITILVVSVIVLGAMLLYGCRRTEPEPPATTTTTEHTTLPVPPPPNGELPTGEAPYYPDATYPHDVYPDPNYNIPANAAPAGFPSPEIQRGAPDPAAQTFTGLRALPERPIEIADPDHSLPTKKMEHAYGIAKQGQPHQISLDNQAFFDAHPEYAAIAYDTRAMQPGGEKTLYLTFDCGYENGNTAIVLDVLKEKGVKAAFFCTTDQLRTAPEIVARMINEGHIVGNHSHTHASFPGISRRQMAEEIITADNYLRTHYGYSAPFFRYPKGEYNESSLEAVASLGFTSVFWSSSYADWDTSAQKGGQYALETVMARLHPGAILLLHSVSSDNAEAMAGIIDQARAQGYVFRELTDLPIFHT